MEPKNRQINLYDRYKNIIPTQARTYLSTLFGNRDKITENDFPQKGKDIINESILNALTSNRNYLNYPDYAVHSRSGEEYKYRSSLFENPEYVIGKANFSINGDSVKVRDRYDFMNEGRMRDVSKYETMKKEGDYLGMFNHFSNKIFEGSMLDALMNSPYRTASQLGNIFIGRDGREVEITLPLTKDIKNQFNENEKARIYFENEEKIRNEIERQRLTGNKAIFKRYQMLNSIKSTK